MIFSFLVEEEYYKCYNLCKVEEKYMNKIVKIIIGITVLLISLILLTFSYYVFQLSPTSKDDKMLDIEIPKGATGTKVATLLKANGLIKDETIFKVYLKIHNVTNINYGIYELNKAMGVKQIVDIISSGDSKSNDIKILFKEGLNMRGIAAAIADKTNNTEDDVFNLLKDDNYIKGLIDEYWFLSDKIQNNDIYYPLEGYLAPNTYQFASKDVTVKEIFKELLDQEDKVLTPYEKDIQASGYTPHQLLTLASIVELEGVEDDDRANIAGVFDNRLAIGMPLGSDVTAYYGAKLNITDKITTAQLNDNNPYNTRNTSFKGLPVGPICNPSISAIEAALNPANNNYYYFLADKNKKVYFQTNDDEFYEKIQELKNEGLWLE
jgi:UPF0755 protein